MDTPLVIDTAIDQAKRFSNQAAQLQQLLLRKAQAHGGNIDVLAMETRLAILQEHSTLLTELVMKATGLNEETFTRLLADRMDAVIAQLTKESTAPLIAVANGMPPRVGRH